MTINRKILTLDEFTVQSFRSIPNATGELSALLRDIGLAAKRINVEVRKIGLVDMLGDAGFCNIQDEEVKKLDVYANNQMIGVMMHGISCAGIASEEMDNVVVFDDTLSNQSKYVVMFDPLDGSSNIDTNISIGTIFGIYKRLSLPGMPCDINDFLQCGLSQVAAGYILYGSSTMLVYATRRGVNGFTLDPETGEFCLSHQNIKCPPRGKIYSINHGNFFNYSAAIQNYITSCQQKKAAEGGPYSNRYTGSMVADMHRTLIKGGVFMYPATKRMQQGKLRLMYECNPFAFIIEVAEGSATSGIERILEIKPQQLHQRIPLIIGSSKMVNEYLSMNKL